MTSPVTPTPVTAGPPVPSIGDPEATFDSQLEAYHAWQKNNLQPEINTIAAQTYTNAVAAGEQATAAENSASNASNSKNAAAASAASAAASAEAAEAAVSALPDGTINDGITTATDTWSSSKINAELGGKANTAALVTKLDIDDVATINGLPLTGGGNIVISAGGVSDGETFATGLLLSDEFSATVPSLTGNAGFRVVALDADRRLFVFGATGALYAVAYNAKTKTKGAVTLVRSASLPATGFAAKLLRTDTVLVAGCPIGSTAFFALVITVSGLSITVGTAATATLSTSMSTTGVGNPAGFDGNGIVTVGDTHLLGLSRSSTDGVSVVPMTESAGTVTIGTIHNAGSVAGAIPLIYHISGTQCVYSRLEAFSLGFTPFTASGGVITAGTAISTSSTGGNAVTHYVTKLSTSNLSFVVAPTTGGTAVRLGVVSVSSNAATISGVNLSVSNGTGVAAVNFGNKSLFCLSNSGTVYTAVVTDASGTASVSEINFSQAGSVFYACETATSLTVTCSNDASTKSAIAYTFTESGGVPSIASAYRVGIGASSDVQLGAVMPSGNIKCPTFVAMGSTIAVPVTNVYSTPLRMAHKLTGGSALVASKSIAQVESATINSGHICKVDNAEVWGMSTSIPTVYVFTKMKVL